MIVPLFSGSGMRVKILEAMALGRVVVTTSLGLEGINAKHKKQVLIADTSNDFVEQLQFCRNNPAKLQKIGENARQLIVSQYDNKVNARRLQEALKNTQQGSLSKSLKKGFA
jgi:glycosyltransferase involved in cell wall biosynthesis